MISILTGMALWRIRCAVPHRAGQLAAPVRPLAGPLHGRGAFGGSLTGSLGPGSCCKCSLRSFPMRSIRKPHRRGGAFEWRQRCPYNLTCSPATAGTGRSGSAETIDQTPIADLRPYPDNVRIHTEASLAARRGDRGVRLRGAGGGRWRQRRHRRSWPGRGGEAPRADGRADGVAPNLLYRWRRLMLEGGSVAVSDDDDVTSNRVVRQLEDRIRELERRRNPGRGPLQPDRPAGGEDQAAAALSQSARRGGGAIDHDAGDGAPHLRLSPG